MTRAAKTFKNDSEVAVAPSPKNIRTQKQLARLAGVSDVTIYNALYRKDLVKPETREKIYQLMAEYDYHPDGIARAMVRGKTNIIGIVLPNFEISYYAKLASALERALNAYGYHCVICQHHDEYMRENRELNMMRELRVDGILLRNCGLATDTNQVKLLARAGVPFVLLDGQTEGFEEFFVGHDDFLGAMNAVERLIAKGHRRISYIGYHRSGDFRKSNRYRGYAAALEKHQIPVDPMLSEAGETEYDSGRLEALNILRRCQNDPPTAFCSVNDHTALGILRGLKEAGITPGEHMAVVGFGGYIDQSLLPFRLSTVRQNIDELAVRSVSMLLAMIDNKPYESGPIAVPCEFIEGESS